MLSNSHRLKVIVKLRPFDEAAWKKLLIAYAYAMHQRRNEQTQPQATEASEAARP
jgi:hypothetical protein